MTMVDRVVQGNTVFIRGSKCEIRITRLNAGKILLKLIGNDHGELGRIPFDDLNHHLEGRRKSDLFIDTSSATGVSLAVTEQWERWFGVSKNKLATVHLFTPSKFFLITAGMIKELSHLGEMFQIYSEKESFRRALGVDSGMLETNASDPTSARSKEQEFAGTQSAFRFIRLRPGVLFIRISGLDTGDRIDQVISQLSDEMKASPGPLQLFVDASETRGVSPHVREEWTKWIAENKDRLLSIDVLSGSRFVTLFVSAAKIFSRTGDLMNIMDHRDEFMRKVEAAAPGSEPLIR